MTNNDYDNLFKQLDNLIKEAPCRNGACVGYQKCGFGINGCYGEVCSIDIVENVAHILQSYKRYW